MLDAEEATGISADEISAEQGFLDESGNFITRAEVAERSGMPPKTFATSEDLTPEGMVNPIPREPPNIVRLPKKGLGEAGKIGISRVFHGTSHKGFDVPTMGQHGVHVGTPEQAAHFAYTPNTVLKTMSDLAQMRAGRVIPLWAKVARELQLPDLGNWDPGTLLTEITRTKALPQEIIDNLWTKIKSEPFRYAANTELRNAILNELKNYYDAISYRNIYEGGKPAESMIILDPLKNLRNALEYPTPEEAFPGENLPVDPTIPTPKFGPPQSPFQPKPVGEATTENAPYGTPPELPDQGGVSPLVLPGMAAGSGGLLALMLKLQQMRQGKNR